MIAAVVSALIVLLLGLSFLHVATSSNVSGSALGFYIDIIHRDSPESPFHDPSSTPFSHLHAAIRRSTARADKFRHVASPNTVSVPSPHINISALIVKASYQYLMRFHMGTPEQLIYAHIDTGSHLTWVLCSPCKNCYPHRDDNFDPNMSDSYEKVPCNSEDCNMLVHKPCIEDCEFNYPYFDGANVYGVLASETGWFSNPETTHIVKVTHLIIGCIHSTEGSFNSDSIGIVGLSGHRLSLFHQLSHHTGDKFSYCLPSKGKSSQIYFGDASFVSGPSAVSTTLYISDIQFLYYIKLTYISIVDPQGTNFIIKIQQIASLSSNNILIDTGTVITYIDPGSLEILIERLLKVITLPRVDTPPKVSKKIVLCFNWTNETELPHIFFVFEGGAKVDLSWENTFEVLDDNIICLLIVSNIHTNGESILGSHSQMNHRIGFDLNALSVTFLPGAC